MGPANIEGECYPDSAGLQVLKVSTFRHFGQLVPFWKAIQVDIASSGQNSWCKMEFEMAKGEV